VTRIHCSKKVGGALTQVGLKRENLTKKRVETVGKELLFLFPRKKQRKELIKMAQPDEDGEGGGWSQTERQGKGRKRPRGTVCTTFVATSAVGKGE